MEFISSWITTVFVNTIFCIISEFIVTDNKLQKLIKSLLGIYFLINLLIPLKNFKIPKFNLDIYTESENKIIENKIESRINKIAKDKIREQISDFLHQNGIKEKNIIIHINKNSRVTCYISFAEGVEGTELILKKLRDKFKIEFFLKN